MSNIVKLLFGAMALSPGLLSAQTWSTVAQNSSAQSGWHEVKCEDGEGWQKCAEVAKGSFASINIYFSRDYIFNGTNTTSTLTAIPMSSVHKNVSGAQHTTIGGNNYSTPETSIITVTNSRPDNIPDCFSYFEGWCMSSEPYMKITLPSTVTLEPGTSFKAALSKLGPAVETETAFGTMISYPFNFDYSTHLLNHLSTRSQAIDTGRRRLHSEGQKLSFGFTSSRFNSGMTKDDFIATSTDFKIPNMSGVVITGTIQDSYYYDPATRKSGYIDAEDLADWAGLDVVGHYRIGQMSSITDFDGIHRQKMASGWSTSPVYDAIAISYQLIPIK